MSNSEFYFDSIVHLSVSKQLRQKNFQLKLEFEIPLNTQLVFGILEKDNRTNRQTKRITERKKRIKND